MTLTEFLEARIAEEEDVARAALGASGRSSWRAKSYRVVVDDGDFEVAAAAVPTAAHMARHDPTRVLAECEAKREVIAICVSMVHPARIGDAIMVQLAAVHSAHADYDHSEWSA